MNEVITKVVSIADEFFVREGMPREAGKRQQLCDIASALVTRAAEKTGLDAKRYQLWMVHRELGAESPYEWRVTTHAFNVIRVAEPFVVDISFCQYMNPKTGTIQLPSDFGTIDTGISFANHHLAQKLLRKGYFRLTNESLRTYLSMSSSQGEQGYIQNATVEGLFSIDPKRITTPTEYTEAQLDKMLDGGV